MPTLSAIPFILSLILIACTPEKHSSADYPNSPASHTNPTITPNIQTTSTHTSDQHTPEYQSQLPISCQQYYYQAQQCFSQQNQSHALQQLLAEQIHALEQSSPSETDCQKLQHSFRAVAQNLNCSPPPDPI